MCSSIPEGRVLSTEGHTIRAASVMAFPKMALLSGLGAALVMVVVLGRPLVVSLVAGVLIFMATGGLNYTKMVIKYLPRDIW